MGEKYCSLYEKGDYYFGGIVHELIDVVCDDIFRFFFSKAIFFKNPSQIFKLFEYKAKHFCIHYYKKGFDISRSLSPQEE